MMSRRLYLGALLGSVSLLGCTDGWPLPADPAVRVDAVAATAPGALMLGAPAAPACASAQVAAWTGTASRTAETYPDDVDVTVTWRLVGSTGCVDRYAPAGDARYRFAIPGALCSQSVSPSNHALAGADGGLTIDRSTAPATFTASATTAWTVTWSCTTADGTETMELDAGGLWLDTTGTVDNGVISGTRVEPDGRLCGLGQSTLPCTYAWSFAPSS